MRNAQRQEHKVARPGRQLLLAENEFELTFDQIQKLILGRMKMKRHKVAGRKHGVPREQTFADMLRDIDLIEDIPSLVLKALVGCSYSAACLHVAPTYFS